MIVVVGLSHKTAPVALRERVTIHADDLPDFLGRLAQRPEIREAFVVSTCNRVEVYVASALREDVDGSRAADAVREVLAAHVGPEVAPLLGQCLFSYAGDSAVRHLFRVAGSLDSLVVGEAQILGQVKLAVDAAAAAGTLGSMLGRVSECAFHVAKRIRSETHIGAGSVSISSVAVELARQIFGDLDGRTAALLGAGTMGEAAAAHLRGAGARIVVVNRNPDRAALVAAKFQAEPRPWDRLDKTIVEADVIIASTTASGYVLTRPMIQAVRHARRGRSLFIIDISVPRNVDPTVNDLDGVYVYDIDDLSTIADQALQERRAEAQHAERIVSEEAAAFEAWLDSLQVTPTIVAFRDRVRDVLMTELHRSLATRLKHLGDADRQALDGMVTAAINKLTHTPTTRLKGAAAAGNAGDLVEALRHLFDLPEHDNAPGVPSRPGSIPPGAEHPDNDRVSASNGDQAAPSFARRI